MRIYQRVFLITSTLKSSTATSFVSCLLVLSYDLFSLTEESEPYSRKELAVTNEATLPLSYSDSALTSSCLTAGLTRHMKN